MTDSANLVDLKFAMHASTSDFTSTPTGVTIHPIQRPTSLLRKSRNPIMRPHARLDGRNLVHAWGAKDLSPFTIEMEMRGVATNTGGTKTWQTSMEQGTLLDSLFGADAAAITVGTVPTLSTWSGTSVTLAGGAASMTVGDMIGVLDTSGNLQIREITAGTASVNLTVDRALTGTPSTGSTVYHCARWDHSASTTAHKHGYFRAEFESHRTDFFGCAPKSFELDFVDGGPLVFRHTWMPNDWQDVAEANPSYAAPTAGGLITGNLQFFIGSTQFLIRDAKFSVDNGQVQRKTGSGPNGVQGGVAADKRQILMTGSLYLGDNALSLNEIVDDSGTPALGIFTGDSAVAGDLAGTYDVAIQAGTAVGQALYLRLPAAAFRGNVVEKDGLLCVDFTAMATAPSSGSQARLGII